jgi:hypothetical protein
MVVVRGDIGFDWFSSGNLDYTAPLVMLDIPFQHATWGKFLSLLVTLVRVFVEGFSSVIRGQVQFVVREDWMLAFDWRSFYFVCNLEKLDTPGCYCELNPWNSWSISYFGCYCELIAWTSWIMISYFISCLSLVWTCLNLLEGAEPLCPLVHNTTHVIIQNFDTCDIVLIIWWNPSSAKTFFG